MYYVRFYYSATFLQRKVKIYLLLNYSGEHRYKPKICAADCVDAVQGHPMLLIFVPTESAHINDQF